MYKVKCVDCGDIGYTAAPGYVKCSNCRGRHKVIPFDKADLKSKGENRIGPFIRQTGTTLSRLTTLDVTTERSD